MHLLTLPIVGCFFYPFYRKSKNAFKTLSLSILFQLYFILSNYMLFFFLQVLPYFLENPIHVAILINNVVVVFFFLYLNYTIQYQKTEEIFSKFFTNQPFKPIK